MKASQKKLFDQIQQRRAECCRRAVRQLMIPLAITFVAILLLKYDPSLTGLKLNEEKTYSKPSLHQVQNQTPTNHHNLSDMTHMKLSIQIQHTKSTSANKLKFS